MSINLLETSVFLTVSTNSLVICHKLLVTLLFWEIFWMQATLSFKFDVLIVDDI